MLGRPDSTGVGDCWSSQDPSDHQCVVRLPDGRMGRLAVFGVIPRTIPYPMEYQVWSYHNVDGNTWVLYLTALPESGAIFERITSLFHRLADNSLESVARKLVVKEGTHYPTGAVF